MTLPEFTFSGCLFLALLLLTVPLNWVGAALLAAGIHELCHMAVILLLGGKILKMTVAGSGARICMPPMSPGRELLAAAAGPAGSFLLLAFRQYLPRTAACGLVQGIFNLLPICPMDGGRILHCFLLLFFPEQKADRICRMAQPLTLVFLGIVTWKKAGPVGLMLILFLLFRIFSAKIPCKDQTSRVQ